MPGSRGMIHIEFNLCPMSVCPMSGEESRLLIKQLKSTDKTEERQIKISIGAKICGQPP